MKNKIELVFTFPACMGGVASFNYNIINYSKIKHIFYTKVILIQQLEDKRTPFLDKFEVDETTTFYFSNKENQYIVQKKLNAIIGSNPGAIITDNNLTIHTANRFNNPKTIFHLIHDFFYVSQNVSAGDLVDVAIAHSSFFSDAVFSSNPILFENRCYFIPYGVKQLETFPVKNNKNLKLVFLGRLEKEKGVLYLKNIDDRLKSKGVNVDWTIIGKGSIKSDLITQWAGTSNIRFEEPSTTDDVFKLLKQQDIFIFPTAFEGTPVSILECLANGIVTITNDLPGGIRDIIKDTSIGYRCLFNNIDQYVQYILELESDRNKLYYMQVNCFKKAQEHYNIVKNSDAYFELFSQCQSLARSIKKTPIPNMSRLDKPYLPNFLVKFIRKL